MPLWPKNEPLQLPTASNLRHWFEKTGVAPLMTSGTWTLANRIVYTPVSPFQIHRRAISIYNGSVVSGLFMMGLYADDNGQPGVRLAQSIKKVQAYTSQWQGDSLGLYTPIEGRNTLWLAAVFDNTTATVTRIAALTVGGLGILGSVFYEDRAALELPAVATPLRANIVLNVPVMLLSAY